ncbi:MAG: hybrid sensor histidine kinase/response regulator, partial [Wenzhouxiangella sp.]
MLLAALTWIACSAQAESQPVLELQYHFDRFAAHPDLAGARVNTVVGDDRGNIWIGTQDGLYEFDGTQVRAHRAASRPGALLDNHVLSLMIDSRGRLWVGTMQGLDRLDPESGAFSARAAASDGTGLAGVTVLSLLEGDEGVIWVGTSESGLYQLDRDGRVMAHFDGLDRDGVLSAPDVWDLAFDTAGDYLWIATEGGLDRLDLGSLEVAERLLPPGEAATRSQRAAVTSVLVDDSGDVWLTTLAGAWRYDRAVQRFESLAGWSEALANPQMHVSDDGRGGLWFSSLESGVVHCPAPAHDCRHRLHQPRLPRSLPGNGVRRSYLDRDGRLWLATTSGLARFVPSRLDWGHYRLRGLDGADPEVWALAQWRGQLYLGTFAHGLWRAPWAELEAQQPEVALARVPVAHPGAWSLKVDSANRLWVSTFGGGLYRFDEPGQPALHLLHDPDDPDSLTFNHVWHLAEDAGGMWVGTYGGGLNLLDPDSGRRLERWLPDSERTISSRRVVLTLRDGEARLWAATYGGGLNRMDDEAAGFRSWVHDPADPASLPHDFLVDLALSPEGELLIATEGGGLARLIDPDQGRFQTRDEETGLLNANLSGLRFTGDGALWVSHKRGLQRYQAGRWQGARAIDGLQDDYFATRSHAEPRPGWLAFGGRGGINVFAPEAISLPAAPAVPRIAEIRLYRAQQREIRAFSADGDWRLDPAVEAIGIRFSSHYLDAEIEPLYRYRLDGGSWVEHHDGSLVLSGLSPGHYRLDLQAAREDRQWSDSANWSFSIRPPWWASSLAWTIYAVALLGSILVAVRFRLRRMAAHNRHLQVLIRARSREHQLRVNALEAAHRQAVSEELLAQKRRLFSSMAHELRTPLTALALTVDAELGQSELARRQPGALEAIRTNIRRLNRVSQQILSLSDAVADDGQPSTCVELRPEVTAITGGLRALLAEREIRVQADVPEGLFLQLKPGSLELILFNLLDNAWKYAGRGARVRIRASEADGSIVVEVIDDGPGMLETLAERAFDRRTRGRDSSRESGQGLGLAAVHAMVEANGGSIELRTAPGMGCHYVIKLPPADPAIGLETEAGDAEPGPGSVGGNKVLGTLLLVEDDKQLRDLIGRLLSSDWRILAYADGREALKAAGEELPDLVVSDVDLPGLRGDELCRRIKQDPVLAHTPVLLLTALDDPKAQAAGLAAQADDYITKPFDGQALKARLRNLWQTLERTREHARRSLLDAAGDNGDASGFVDELKKQAEILLDQGRLSVDNLAAALNVSTRHLGRQFSRQLGDLNPRDYIDRLHARRAGERIAAGATLEQVAEELGYSSSSYLGRKFRQWYGVSV